MNNYDIIGDVHGHYDELISLIFKLGYEKVDSDIYVHPKGRKLIFVGDLIDRGPKIRETLRLVKTLVDNNLALCIKGNHEYNAINFWTLNGNGYYREHSHKNIVQHYKTIEAFINKEDEWNNYLNWMNTLPIVLEMDNFRVVHASYHSGIIQIMTDMKYMEYDDAEKNQTIMELSQKSKNINDIVEIILKGADVKLPEGIYFYDKDGTKRNKSRVKWWLSPVNMMYTDYLESYASKAPELKNIKVDIELIDKAFKNGYPIDEKPIFFGHYWLKMEDGLHIQTPNVCCLDYSIAKKGHLVAYRYDGEKVLSDDKFIYVEAN